MPTGKVAFFNQAKGYGFICLDDGGADCFVRVESVEAAGLEILRPNQATGTLFWWRATARFLRSIYTIRLARTGGRELRPGGPAGLPGPSGDRQPPETPASSDCGLR